MDKKKDDFFSMSDIRDLTDEKCHDSALYRKLRTLVKDGFLEIDGNFYLDMVLLQKQTPKRYRFNSRKASLASKKLKVLRNDENFSTKAERDTPYIPKTVRGSGKIFSKKESIEYE